MSRNKQTRPGHLTRPTRHGDWWVNRRGDDLIVPAEDCEGGADGGADNVSDPEDRDDYAYPTRNLYQTMECR